MRRVARTLLIAIAVFSILQCVTATVATQPMLSTTGDITRGQRLTANDVTVITVPAHTSFANAPTEPKHIESRIALVDMPAGTLVLPSHIRGTPVAPEGTTVIETRLASKPEGVDAGDEIDLMIGQACASITPDTSDASETPETPESSETPDGQHPQDTAPTTPSRQCTIATQATLIAFSQRADGTTADSASIAMRPEEALTIMSLPDSLPVIATRR